MNFNKTKLLVLLTTISSTLLHGQNDVVGQAQKKKIIPQFEFTQIDSLVDNAIHKINITDSQATVVASVRWYIGSYSNPTDKYSTHRNHFDIYIFSCTNKSYCIQKIDNFGYFKVKKIGDSKVNDFLTSHLNEMQSEKLNPPIDTTYETDGNMSTTQHIIDHQLLVKLKIVKANNKLEYEYPANYSENKYNLLTYRFKFLQLIGELQKRFDKKKHKRTAATYGFYNPEY